MWFSINVFTVLYFDTIFNLFLLKITVVILSINLGPFNKIIRDTLYDIPLKWSIPLKWLLQYDSKNKS